MAGVAVNSVAANNDENFFARIHPSERSADAHPRSLVQRLAVDAVGYHDRHVVAAACGRGRRLHATIRVHKQRVESMFRQRELEIGPDETLYRFFVLTARSPFS